MKMSKLSLLIFCFWSTLAHPIWADDVPTKVLLTDFKFRTLNQFLFPNYFLDSLTEELVFEKALDLIKTRIGECEIETYQSEKIRYDVNTGNFNLKNVPRDGFKYFVQISSHIDGIQDIFLGAGLLKFKFTTRVKIETPEGKEVFTHQHSIPFNSEQEYGFLFDERIMGKEDFTGLYIQSLEGAFDGKDNAKNTLKFSKPAITIYDDFLSEARRYAIDIKVGVFGRKLNFFDVNRGNDFVVEMKEGMPLGSETNSEGVFEKSKMRKSYTVNHPLAHGSYKIKTLYKSAKLIANFITVGEPSFTLLGIKDKQEIFYFQAGIYEDRFDAVYSPQLLKIEGIRERNTFRMIHNTFSNFLEIKVNDTIVGMILLGQANFDEAAPGADAQYQLFIKEGSLPDVQVMDAFLIYIICNDFLVRDVM